MPTDYTIIDDTFSLAIQPGNILIPLKTHQLALLNKCRGLELSSKDEINTDNANGSDDINYNFKSKIGIIGDKVGSGKTLTVLGIISDKKIISDHELPKTVNRSNLIYYKQQIPPTDTSNNFKPYNIIVVPHTIINQWRETLDNYTNLKYFEITNKKTLTNFTEIFNNTKNNDRYKTFTEHDIILISNSKYNDFCSLNLIYWSHTSNSIFSRVIFDEADTIKIPSCREIRSSFTWFVTSTYKSLIHPYRVQYMNPETGELSNQ